MQNEILRHNYENTFFNICLRFLPNLASKFQKVPTRPPTNKKIKKLEMGNCALRICMPRANLLEKSFKVLAGKVRHHRKEAF